MSRAGMVFHRACPNPFLVNQPPLFPVCITSNPSFGKYLQISFSERFGVGEISPLYKTIYQNILLNIDGYACLKQVLIVKVRLTSVGAYSACRSSALASLRE